jgi:putative aminopeptidase FrvX
MTEFLTDYITRQEPSAKLITLGSSIIAVRGEGPTIAVMAHTDTTGFTAGYDNMLIPIGGPVPTDGDKLRIIGNSDEEFQAEIKHHEQWVLKGSDKLPYPGARLVYAAKPVFDGNVITAPYLDNRAGLWAALGTLHNCPNIAVAFTSGEEVSGLGARSCARYLACNLSISHVLISDITWDTQYVHIGKGPAISLRDTSVPNRQFVDQIATLAGKSGIPYQIEIESDGGSDGAHIEDGSYPMDWVFVGAPEGSPHSSHERLSLNDLSNMAEILTYLVTNMSLQNFFTITGY